MGWLWEPKSENESLEEVEKQITFNLKYLIHISPETEHSKNLVKEKEEHCKNPISW